MHGQKWIQHTVFNQTSVRQLWPYTRSTPQWAVQEHCCKKAILLVRLHPVSEQLTLDFPQPFIHSINHRSQLYPVKLYIRALCVSGLQQVDLKVCLHLFLSCMQPCAGCSVSSILRACSDDLSTAADVVAVWAPMPNKCSADLHLFWSLLIQKKKTT